MSVTPIVEFKAEHRFLSNFYVEPERGGWTNEHFFQAEKSSSPADRARVMAAKTPMEAKRIGRHVTLRPDWDEVKNSVMLSGLRSKFHLDAGLGSRLMDTYPAVLIEGNRWNDTYWGVDLETGEGHNHLGLLLMEVREELLRGAGRWTLVLST